MNKRLEQFLSAENISQSQFADTLGVARASISHILNGRNKPGYDFFESMILHYPALNLEWLFTGKGKMFKTSPSESRIPVADTAVTAEIEFPEPETEPAPLPIMAPKAPVRPVESAKKPAISKILVFYSDGTYKELC